VTLFPHAHATHPQWQMAVALVLAQLRAQMAMPDYAAQPSLGMLYITDHYAHHAQDLLDQLSAELPMVTDWVGTVGVGVVAPQVEYLDEPALAVMLCDLDPQHYRVFSGVSPLPVVQDAGGFVAHTALVHADGQVPDLPDLLVEMADRTRSHYLFGGLASSRGPLVQFARSSRGGVAGQGTSAASGVFLGGLSGVAFSASVPLLSRVTQGVRPVSPSHRITQATGNLVLALDGQPALDVLLSDLGLSLEQPSEAVARLRQTLVGLTAPRSTADQGGLRPQAIDADVQVRHVLGLDPGRRAVAVADHVPDGGTLVFCERHRAAARADLMRIGTEIREALEPEALPADMAWAMRSDDLHAAPHPARRIAGALYVSCSGRGGAHFGGPNAELLILRRALGDVPLVGFFAGGEIAHHRLHGYTGVLTVFVADSLGG